MKTSKKGIDLTEGPIAKQIILFAVPLFLSSLIQQLYNTVDLIFVGQCLDTDATAAVGASSMLITLMIGFFNGLSIGIGIIMAKAFGSGNKKRMQEVIHNAAGLSVAGAFILMVIVKAYEYTGENSGAWSSVLKILFYLYGFCDLF